MGKYPKLVIVSNGCQTAALLDGVLLGPGIERLEFSTENRGGESRASIRLLEVDVAAFKTEVGAGALERLLERMAEPAN